MYKNLPRLTKSSVRLIKPTFSTKSTETTKEQQPQKMDQMKSNPYFSKYQNKLKAVYDEDPESFLYNLKNQKLEVHGNPEDHGIDLGINKTPKMSKTITKKRTLDTIVKLDMLKDLHAHAIEAIWTSFLSELNYKLPGMISECEYKQIALRSCQFTTLVFPLPRQQGYEFILAQWAGQECHFTPLINYQAHGAEAPTIMTIVYFDELLESKKIALEMTEIDTNNLKVEEAKFLIHLMKEFYVKCEDGDVRHEIMRVFTNEPDKYDHMSIVEFVKNEGLNVDRFKGITDIQEATKGILEKVEPEIKAPIKKIEKNKYKEKDLADFS